MKLLYFLEHCFGREGVGGWVIVCVIVRWGVHWLALCSKVLPKSPGSISGHCGGEWRKTSVVVVVVIAIGRILLMTYHQLIRSKKSKGNKHSFSSELVFLFFSFLKKFSSFHHLLLLLQLQREPSGKKSEVGVQRRDWNWLGTWSRSLCCSSVSVCMGSAMLSPPGSESEDRLNDANRDLRSCGFDDVW